MNIELKRDRDQKTLQLNENKVKNEMEKVKEVKYKLTDLLYSIEKGNIERVEAHIRLGTPLNEQTVVHRDFSKTYDAIEFAAKSKQYYIFDRLLENDVNISEKVLKEAKEDRILRKILEKRLKI